jgi:hypothetical protein
MRWGNMGSDLDAQWQGMGMAVDTSVNGILRGSLAGAVTKSRAALARVLRRRAALEPRAPIPRPSAEAVRYGRIGAELAEAFSDNSRDRTCDHGLSCLPARDHRTTDTRKIMTSWSSIR